MCVSVVCRHVWEIEERKGARETMLLIRPTVRTCIHKYTCTVQTYIHIYTCMHPRLTERVSKRKMCRCITYWKHIAGPPHGTPMYVYTCIFIYIYICICPWRRERVWKRNKCIWITRSNNEGLLPYVRTFAQNTGTEPYKRAISKSVKYVSTATHCNTLYMNNTFK